MKIVVILAVLISPSLCTLCPENKFWSNEIGVCLTCLKCSQNQITVKKCQSHSNTECSDIPDLRVEKNLKVLEEDKLIPKHLIKSNDEDGDILKDFLHRKMKGKKEHKNHYSFKKKRPNDRFLDWDSEEENLETNRRGKHHHHHFPAEYKHKDEHKTKKKSQKKNNDEEKLEEWLTLSRKQFKQRKEDLLKNMRQDELDSDEEGKKIRLNYPLYRDDNLIRSSSGKVHHKEKVHHKSPSEDEIFKNLIKTKNEGKNDFESLMSNKKESLSYRPVTPSHRKFLGEPSTISEIIGQVKDPQEVIKEEMGRNVFYEKSKFSVVPLVKDGDTVISAVPFTAAERFVWDWQAVAVASAVAACLMFFIVVTIYGIFNARQWRATKSPSYTADMEEMSTRIALMHPTLETSAAEGNSTGKYLENVLNPPKN